LNRSAGPRDPTAGILGKVRRNIPVVLLVVLAITGIIVWSLADLYTKTCAGGLWAVLTSEEVPPPSNAHWLLYVLSGFGYIAVPVVIALAVSDIALRIMRKGHTGLATVLADEGAEIAAAAAAAKQATGGGPKCDKTPQT
jgi:hypothetical protein